MSNVPTLKELIPGGVRLAFRTEGDFVNCYLAPTETMDGALLVSSIRKSALTSDEPRTLWSDWRQTMGLWLDRLVAASTGLPLESVTHREEEPREPPAGWPLEES